MSDYDGPGIARLKHEVAMLSGRSWKFIIGNTAKAMQQRQFLVSSVVAQTLTALFIQSCPVPL